jgi:hypothetical protein
MYGSGNCLAHTGFIGPTPGAMRREREVMAKLMNYSKRPRNEPSEIARRALEIKL